MKQVFRVLAFFVVLLMLVATFAPVPVVNAQDSISTIQDNISSLSKKLKQAQAQQTALSSQLSQINTSLSATQQAIAATKIRIAQAANDIDRKQAEIDLIQARIEGNRVVLAGLMREIQAGSKEPFLDVVLSGEEVTQALNEQDRMLSVEERIRGILSD
ncbi:MAG TPA: hypothetical protein VN437_06750, partial [Rectinemataceae bacterium]|nr:hypothetical protein [Rectinemataceae bacterium]